MLFSSFCNLVVKVRYYTPCSSVQNAVVTETAAIIAQVAQSGQIVSVFRCETDL